MPISAFISSTFVDLERHRALVRKATAHLDVGAQMMELFGALPETPKEECLRLVRSANVYIGVFAMRYGSIDLGSGKSLTQLEYEEAQAVRLPSLIYLIDENLHPVLPKHVELGASADKLLSLKSSLRASHVVSLFSSPEDLAKKVSADLARLVLSRDETPTAQVLSQIASHSVRRHPLTPPRFDFLKGTFKDLFPVEIPDSLLREALELAIAGDNMAAAFVLSRGVPMPLDTAVDGLMTVESVLADLLQKHRATNPSDV